MDFVLRDALTEDLPVLQDVYRRASLSNEHDRDNLLRHPEFLVYSRRACAEARVRVAVGASRVVAGFAATRHIAGHLELVDLFVSPGWVRKGIGSLLIEDAKVYAVANSIARIEVDGNPHALLFYQNVGFIDDGEVQTELGPGHRLHLDV